jgi:hypothetical protein
MRFICTSSSRSTRSICNCTWSKSLRRHAGSFPRAPLFPGLPLTPGIPRCPPAPVAPRGPVFPRAPLNPLAPVGPRGPGGPVGPGGPGIRRTLGCRGLFLFGISCGAAFLLLIPRTDESGLRSAKRGHDCVKMRESPGCLTSLTVAPLPDSHNQPTATERTLHAERTLLVIGQLIGDSEPAFSDALPAAVSGAGTLVVRGSCRCFGSRRTLGTARAVLSSGAPNRSAPRDRDFEGLAEGSGDHGSHPSWRSHLPESSGRYLLYVQVREGLWDTGCGRTKRELGSFFRVSIWDG